MVPQYFFKPKSLGSNFTVGSSGQLRWVPRTLAAAAAVATPCLRKLDVTFITNSFSYNKESSNPVSTGKLTNPCNWLYEIRI